MTTLDNITLSDPIASILYQHSLLLLPTEQLDQKNIVLLTIRMMQIIQELADDKRGDFRKTMLLLVLKKIVDNNNTMSVEEKSLLIKTIDTTISCMVDETIKVWNRETTFYPRSRCNCLRNVFRNCIWCRAYSFDKL